MEKCLDCDCISTAFSSSGCREKKLLISFFPGVPRERKVTVSLAVWLWRWPLRNKSVEAWGGTTCFSQNMDDSVQNLNKISEKACLLIFKLC